MSLFPERIPLIHEVFAKYSEQHPEQIAAVFCQNTSEESITYGYLHRTSNQLAHYLRFRGIGPEMTVGIAIDRADGLLMLICFWAVLKAGGTLLLLNPSQSYPEERRSFLIREAGVCLILTQTHLLSALPSHLPSLPLSRSYFDDFPSEFQITMPSSPILEHHLAYKIATSGTTPGEPKVVEIEHRSLANLATAQQHLLGLHPEDRILQFAAWTFDVTYSEILMASTAGATLVMGTRRELSPGPELVDFLSTHLVTVAAFTPSVLTDPQMPLSDLSPLHTLICGGEVLRASVVSRYSRSGLKIFNAYGPTECTVVLTYGACQGEREPPDVGFPLSGVELVILDEQRQRVPSGSRGTLYASGLCLARGYSKHELTAERFPILLGRRWYNTGDEACLFPSGRIQIFGRIEGDRQVKVLGGRRVQLEEVEEALSRHHAIQQAIVQVHNQQKKLLVAYIFPKEDQCDLLGLPSWSSSEEIAPTLLGAEGRHQLTKFLFGQGLEHYMIPEHYLVLATFPRTNHEKIDERALQILFLSLYKDQQRKGGKE